MSFPLIISLLFLVVVCFPSTAHAYLDPGTGSILLQSLAMGFLAATVFWRRIVDFIKKLFKKNQD